MMDEQRELPTAAQLVVANRYAVDLDTPVGAGGMALVYRGHDLRTRHDVAMKTLRIEYRRDPETRARFRREVRTLAFLTHPNVVKIFDLYEDDEAPWAVMEFIQGVSLKELVRSRGRLNLEETANILQQIAAALHHLHAQGLVHLDVKPQNVIVQADGVVKLIDFGLAQPAHVPQELIGGSTFGTVSYLAPEQASGEAVDVHTDVYALGCVVYEMLTGRAPFDDIEGEATHDVVRAHLQDEPTPPSMVEPRGSLPPSIDPIVLGALAKRPEDRYGDALTFATLFRNVVDDVAASRGSREPVDVAPIDVSHSRSWRRGPAANSAPQRRPSKLLVRTARWRRLAWWIVGVLVAINLALATLIVIDRGELPPLIDRPSALAPGRTARVRVDELNVRSAAGDSSDVIASVAFGRRGTVTGDAVDVGGELWWPVRFVINGDSIEGYVWDGGVEPAGTGVLGDIQNQIDGLRRSFGDVTGWTP